MRTRSICSGLRPMPCTTSGSRTISPTVMRGLSDEYGSWNTIWISRRRPEQLGAARVRQVAALEAHAAGGGLLQPHQRAAQRGLAAAGLAHQPQRLARQHLEADAGHGLDAAGLCGPTRRRAPGSACAGPRPPAAARSAAVMPRSRQPPAAESGRPPSLGRRRAVGPQHRILVAAAPLRRGVQRLVLAGSGRQSGSPAAGAAARARCLRWSAARPCAPRPCAGCCRAGRACRGGAAPRRVPPPAGARPRGRRTSPTTASHISAMTPMSWVMNSSAVPLLRCSSRIRCRICACTVTSSAVVGSSAISSRGSHSSAMAIITRCFMPPESSCG